MTLTIILFRRIIHIVDELRSTIEKVYKSTDNNNLIQWLYEANDDISKKSFSVHGYEYTACDPKYKLVSLYLGSHESKVRKVCKVKRKYGFVIYFMDFLLYGLYRLKFLYKKS